MGDGGIPLELHHLLSPGMAFSSVANGHFVQLGREILHYPKAQELGLDLPPLPSACYIGCTGVFDGCSAPVLSDENMRFGVSAPRSRSRRWASASVGDCLQIVSEVSVVATLTSFSSMLYVSSILLPQNVPMKPWLTRTAGGLSLSSHQFCMDELRASPDARSNVAPRRQGKMDLTMSTRMAIILDQCSIIA